MRFKRLQDWLAWQQTLHSQKIELGLSRIEKVACDLGVMQPEFQIVTVAGTNGKGSITAILESVYHHAGYRVATYTSPHLLSYNERVRIDKKNTADQPLCEAFDIVDQARGETSLSYFEFSTLAAMLIFSNTKLDVAVFEVGLGGRLDAVNIYDADISIVSNIGMDHVQWLGSTREAIGLEKAGIFRAHKPAVCGDGDPPDSLLEHARAIGSELYLIDRDFSCRQEGETWSFQSEQLTWDSLPMPSLYGDAQLVNAAVALMSVQCLDDVLPVKQESIGPGMQDISLCGRFQRGSGECEIIFDVAPNLDSAEFLRTNLQELGPVSNTYAVFAVLKDKDVDGIIEAMCEQIDEWYISEIDSERSLSCRDLQASIERLDSGGVVKSYPSVSEAWFAARDCSVRTSRIVVFGSFLTVAEVLSLQV